MLVHFLLLIPFSYTLFVFTSGFSNPFVAVKGPLKRRRWRIGRAAALASLIAGTVAIVMLHVYKVPTGSVLVTYFLLLGLCVLPSLIKNRKNPIWN